MLVCGIDIGSTNLKVGLSDGSGRLLSAEVVPTPRTGDDAGIVTDPVALLGRVEGMVLDAWRRLGANRPIRAIATTGVGEDGVLLDAGLRPLDNVIPWFDRRASADAAAIRVDAATARRAGIAMEPTRTAAKWRWLSRHRPEAHRQAHLWVALTDYPLIAWGAAPFISQTLAARTACYDPFMRGWIDELLAASHAPPLPAARPAGTIVGQMACPRLIGSGAVTERTLLVAGGHDHPIAASAIHRLDRNARIDSLGTASVLYGETTQFRPGAPDPLIAYSVPVRGGEGMACIGVFEFSGALDTAGSRSAVRDYLAATPLPGDPGTPQPIGTGGTARRGIRQVLEAASMTSRAMFDGFAASGVAPGPIYATGGWSRSHGLLQLRASVLGQSLFTADEAELALVGAALIAAGATDAPASFAPAIRKVDPVAEWQRIYDAAYPGFLDLLHAGSDR
ncbi:FGGY family carbohydrate kinase [Paracoccus sp. (in: a-proteobacteria)]|uniref:FGGY family carbohydrate kinase n=1 Tax=Paracoccus sp. TaxID=267 RepID=UPI003A84A857